jgi:flagellar biogenesis protein FliO
LSVTNELLPNFLPLARNLTGCQLNRSQLNRSGTKTMKSFHLWLLPLVLALSYSTSLWGQERSSEIRLHRQAAAVSVEPTSASAQTFPAFARRGNDQVLSDAPLGDQSKIAVPAVTVTSSLAVVLGLFAGLVWLTRKYGSRSMNQGAVPKEVLKSLGSTPIDSRTRITMLRCGNRILVVAQTASGLHPLSEITDPEEVRELTAACLGDSKHKFNSTLQSVEAEKTNSGFVDANAGTPATRARSRGSLFATT